MTHMITNLFKGAGIKDVKLIIYPQARHEMQNELNPRKRTRISSAGLPSINKAGRKRHKAS
ncbi:hypothetical protein [Paenibacillus sp. OK076]|uniref:hypothetical protein n=1 Tax=Paenibacillus sp. OK076 TaxID=1884379 RepID=UPI000B8600FC|nr:hypothetical protein [Paenibacillus sp. OK076]